MSVPFWVSNGFPSLPTGAIGIWYADQYATSPKKHIPNAASATAASSNVINAPRRMFNKTRYWTKSSLTVADNAANNEAGAAEASTVTGLGYFDITGLPSAQYTVVVKAKRGGGSDSQFKTMFVDGGAQTQTFTATSAFQRFALTGNGTQVLTCRSPDDGTTAVDLIVESIDVFAGAVDLGAETLAGHLYLGQHLGDTRATVSAGALDVSAAATGGKDPVAIAQFASGTTYTNFTAIAIGSKVRDATSADSFLSSLQASTEMANYFENGTIADSVYGTKSLNLVESRGGWKWYDRGWHAITNRWDGTNQDLFLDDIRLASEQPASPVVPTIADFGVNAFGGTYKIAAMAIWNRALSDAEVRTAYYSLAYRAARSGHAITAERIIINTGDSIAAGSDSSHSYFILYGPNADPVFHGANYGVGGYLVSNLVTQATFIDAIIPPNKGSRKFILTVMIGHNDLNAMSAASFLTAYAAYLDARRAAGWTVGMCTLLPSTDSGFNTKRAATNPTLSTWVGVHCDFLIDFAADPDMGPDEAASDTDLYSDGTHPTEAGQALLEVIYRAAVNAA